MRKFKVAQIPSSRAVKRKFKHSKLKPYTVISAYNVPLGLAKGSPAEAHTSMGYLSSSSRDGISMLPAFCSLGGLEESAKKDN